MLDWIIALGGGVLAAANLIIGMQPRAKELIDKLTPYQGAIGLFMLGWGVWNIVNMSLIHAFKLIGLMPVTAIAIIGMIVLLVLVGFILGFGLLSKYVLSRNEQAAAKGEQLRAKLAPLTGILGFILIGCALWLILNFYVLKIVI